MASDERAACSADLRQRVWPRDTCHEAVQAALETIGMVVGCFKLRLPALPTLPNPQVAHDAVHGDQHPTTTSTTRAISTPPHPLRTSLHAQYEAIVLAVVNRLGTTSLQAVPLDPFAASAR